MKTYFALVLFAFFMIIISCNTTEDKSMEDSKIALSENGYDQNLAKKLNADDYGMSTYIMAFLKRGPDRPQDSVKIVELQAAHMKNIRKLADEGILVLAGPFLDDGDLRGIYIFDVESIEEAKKLTESDPAIQAGSLIMELHPWYGSTAIKSISEIHEKISRIKI